MGKRITGLFMAIVGISGGVWLYSYLHRPIAPRIADPFSQPYKLTKDNVAFYTDGDTMKTIVYSGVFYWGAAPLPGNRAAEFDEARRAKVVEMLDEADRIRKKAFDIRPKLDALRARLLEFLTAAKSSRGLSSFASKVCATMARNNGKEAAGEIMYDSCAKAASKDAYAQAMLEETRVNAAVGTALCYLDDVTFLTAAAALCHQVCAADASLQPAADKLALEIQGMGELYDEATQLADAVKRVEFGYRQIRTGDYRYAKAVTSYVRSRLPGLRSALAKTKAGKNVHKDDIALAKSYLGVCEKVASALDKSLARIASTDILPRQIQTIGLGPSAYGDESQDEYAAAFRALRQPSQGVAEKRFLPTWEETKTAFKKVQRGVQLTTDTIGNGWDAMTRSAAGAYYGDTWQDIKLDLAKIGQRQSDNWNGKPLRQTTLRKGKEYLDAVEADAEKAAAEYAKSKGAGEWTSWGVGKVGKVLVGTFTGVGKGIALLSDPNSTKADYVEGSLELLLASIGGSKTLLKARQVPGLVVAGGEEALQAAKMGWAALMRKRLTDQIGRLRELIPNLSPEELLSTRKEIITKLMASRAWGDVVDALKTEMGAAMKAGMKAGWQNAKSTAAQSWEEMWKELGPRTIKNQLGSMWKTLAGDGALDALDNYWGAIADDWLKGKVGDIMREEKPADIGGTYTGTLTFTRIDPPKNLSPATRKGEGCDVDFSNSDLLKNILNHPLPVTVVISPTSADGGIIRLGNPSAKKSPATKYVYYEEGVIRATFTEGGGEYNLSATIAASEGATTIEGTLSGSANGAYAEATLSGKRKQ